MDELNDLVWGSTHKEQPPSKPQRLAATLNTKQLGNGGSGPLNAANVSSSTLIGKQPAAAKDAFSGLVSFDLKSKPSETTNLSLDEQRRRKQQQSTAPFSPIPPGQPSKPVNPVNGSWPSLIPPLSTSLSNSLTASVPAQPYSMSIKQGLSPQPIAKPPATSMPKPTNQKSPSTGRPDAFLDLLGSNGFGDASFGNDKARPLNALKPTSQPPNSYTVPPGKWDFDLLDSSLSSSARTASAAMQPSFDPFDMLPQTAATFAASNTYAPQSQDDDDSNPLGILAEPVKPRHPSTRAPPHTQQEEPPSSKQTSSADHLIAQIVDMGFTAMQAKMALEATRDGKDVGTAIEFLLQERDIEESSGLIAVTGGRNVGGRGRGTVMDSSDDDDDDDSDEEGNSNRRHSRGGIKVNQNDSDEERSEKQQVGNRGAQKDVDGGDGKPAVSGGLISDFAARRKQFMLSFGATAVGVSATNPPLPSEQKTAPQSKPPRQELPDTENDGVLEDREKYREARQKAFNAQKEKIVAQASELGGFLYKNASVLLRQGKEKLGKTIEDINQPTAEPASDGVTNAASQREYKEEELEKGHYAPYEDSSDDDLEVSQPFWKPEAKANDKGKDAATSQQTRSQQTTKQKHANDAVYVSPARRRPAPPGTLASPSTTILASAQARNFPQTNNPAAPEPTRPPRKIVSCNPHQLEESEKHKKRGNELFKLGQFGEAETHYSLAIQSLPSEHDHLILVYNNRAATRLKNGEYKATIQDCETILQIVGEAWFDCADPTVSGVNLKEQVIKALTRQAQAHENLEKYRSAVEIWKKLGKVEGGRSSLVNDALRRCEKAQAVLEGKIEVKGLDRAAKVDSISFEDPRRSHATMNPFSAAAMAAAAAAAPPPATSAAILNKSAAVAKLRSEAALVEAQDAEKFRLHDAVQGRLLLWKQGKEKNVRALLTSLESVLWASAGWRNVGMAEVIDAKRVKIVYMRAIAKVHPDKLKPSTTVEQRLLANGIFSALNDAWDDFKAQNGL